MHPAHDSGRGFRVRRPETCALHGGCAVVIVRDRMGWLGGVLEGSGWGKPKGMHWRIYERLCDEHDTFEHAVNLSFIDRFGPMLKKGGF
jgi:hypothetical protein